MGCHHNALCYNSERTILVLSLSLAPVDFSAPFPSFCAGVGGGIVRQVSSFLSRSLIPLCHISSLPLWNLPLSFLFAAFFHFCLLRSTFSFCSWSCKQGLVCCGSTEQAVFLSVCVTLSERKKQNTWVHAWCCLGAASADVRARAPAWSHCKAGQCHPTRDGLRERVPQESDCKVINGEH